MSGQHEETQPLETDLVGKYRAPVLAADVVSLWVLATHTTMYLGVTEPGDALEAFQKATDESPARVPVRCVAMVVLPHAVAIEVGRLFQKMTPQMLAALSQGAAGLAGPQNQSDQADAAPESEPKEE